MKVFGLTGGMGMGKSAAAQILCERGVPLADTDLLARQIVEPGHPASREIQEVFGREFLDQRGQLRRDKLAGIVFADPAARQKLESITHPRIRELWKKQMAVWREEQKPLAVVVIPLLFETGAETEFDATICVACSPETQRRRLLERGWTSEQIGLRLAAQLPAEEKISRSDFVAWNDAGLDVLGGQLDRIIDGGT